MSVDYLEKVNRLVQKHIKIIMGLLGIVILGSIIGLKFIKYNNNIESMLPADPQVQQSMRFLRESNFSDKLIISLKLKDPQHTTDQLIEATDQLITSIKSPLVKQIIGNISTTNFMQEMIFFLEYSPQLLSPVSFAKLQQSLNPAGIKERLAFIYRQSLTPQSSFTMPFLRIDPLNLNSEILGNIQKLSQASGYDVTINNGHLLSKDGTASMIIIKTSVLLTEGFGSRKIINYLQEKLQGMPDFISSDIIAGHMHTVKNEDIIKRDIWLTSVIAALGFILLFLCIFRDWRAIIIFFMPFVAVLITTQVGFFIFKNLSYFVIGLSSVIAGITIDYGIYVYMAVRKAGNSLDTLRKILKPVVFSALTTISVFGVFFFSSVSGYHQMAFFSNFSILLCMGFALFILPHLIKEEAPADKIKLTEKNTLKLNLRLPDYLWLIIWGILVIIMLGLATKLKFNNDINQFDGVGKEVTRAEEEFHNTWGGKNLPAVFVTPAKTLQGAYEINWAVYLNAVEAIGKDNFISLSSIWPGMLKRKSNLDSWNKFWNPENKNKFKELLVKYGKPYNFSAEAFNPFTNLWDSPKSLEVEPKGLAFFEQLKDQFVFKKDTEYQLLSFFPDQDIYIAKLSEIKQRFPGTFLVSRKNFSQQVSRALSKEFTFLSFLALFATIGLAGLLLRKFRLTVLAMVPVISSLALIGGVTYLTGLSLNIPAIIASMVVVGIVSDYGIFMVYYCKYKYETGTIIAVTLAAVTTLIGTGVLLFAWHPVLFSIGVTLTTGVLAGYLSSLLIIPAAYRLWKEN